MMQRFLCLAFILLAFRAGTVAAQEEATSTPTPTPAPTSATTSTPVPTLTPTPTSTPTPAYPGVVVGTVFHDRDLDGVRDAGEEGLEGWDIEAYPVATGDIFVQAGRMFTGPDGSFHIENLDVSWPTWQLDASLWQGSVFDHYYRVDFPQPYAFSFKDDLVRVDIPVAFDDDTEVTFHVWEDFDGDGVVSAADELALWTDVVIETPEGTWVFEASGPVTTLTLTGLLPGEYLAHAASTDPLNEVPFVVKPGIAQAPLELLMKPQITFYGYVYEDANENGQRDQGERGLPRAGVEVETRNADGSGGGVGRSTEPDGSYVLSDLGLPDNQEAYVGCGNYGDPTSNGQEPQGFWRATIGMTYSHHGLSFQNSPVVIQQGVYRYPVDCGLVYQPRQPPIIVIVPVSGDGIGLPYSGSGGSDGSEMSWAALALAGVGVLLIAGTTRAKWKRPDPCGPGPRFQ